MHFEIRKHLLEYDNVMNQQRKIVYGLRRSILSSHEITNIIREELENLIDLLITTYIINAEEPDLKSFSEEMEKIFGIIEIDFSTLSRKNPLPFKEYILGKAQEKLKAKIESLGEHFEEVARFVMLNILDTKWKEHLLTMDHLRDSVGLRGYGQKDPLIEYKKESYNIFMEMMQKIYYDTIELMMHVQIKETENLEFEERDIKVKRNKGISSEKKMNMR